MTTTRRLLFSCFLVCVVVQFSGVLLEFGHVSVMMEASRLKQHIADSAFPSTSSSSSSPVREGIIQQTVATYCPPPRRRNLQKVVPGKPADGTTSSGTSSTTQAAVLCAVAKDEEAYLDEWVNYHLAIGFETIYVYDNSDTNELRQWGKAKAAAVQNADAIASASSLCRSSASSNHSLVEGHNNNNDDRSLLPSRVQVIPWPGEARQFDAYWDCGNRSAHGTVSDIASHETGANNGAMLQVEPATWAAFWDIDEFFVLRQHDRVAEFLKEYCTSGSLAISWIIMGGTTRVSGNLATNVDGASLPQQEQRLVYSPLPVTKRFLYRDISEEGLTNSRHVKSIVKLSDLKLIEEDGSGKIAPFDHPHLVKLRKGVAQRDTNGHAFSGPRNRDGPRDVAVLYHYNAKSRKEYIRKRARGRAPLPKNHTSNSELLQQAQLLLNNDKQKMSTRNVTLYDDTVWKAVKKYVPEYALYDQLSIIPL